MKFALWIRYGAWIGSGPKRRCGDRARARLLGVVDEVALRPQVGVLADDLDAVLVGAHGAVGTHAVENGARRAVVFDVQPGVVVEARVGDVVVDADREMLFRLRLLHLGEHGHHHRRRELLRRQAVTAADDVRHRLPLAVDQRFRQRRDDVLVERFAAARQDSLVRSRTAIVRTDSGRAASRCSAENGRYSRTSHEADAFGLQCVDRLRHGVGAGTHHDDDAFCVRVAVIVEQPVLPARDVAEALHGPFDDPRSGVVVVG